MENGNCISEKKTKKRQRNNAGKKNKNEIQFSWKNTECQLYQETKVMINVEPYT